MIIRAGALGFARRKKLVSLTVLIALVAIGFIIWYFVIHKKSEPVITSNGATSSQVENALAADKSKSLAVKNYDQYIGIQRSLATQYLANGDTHNAERILNDIVKNVPEDKIPVDVYMDFWNVAKTKNDSVARKKYAQKVVSMLKAEIPPNQKLIDSWNQEL
ncbi:hypothetical protein HY857_00720 [Candidatus Saccharibacteria bacterium]|nr:hypothetical protein [Candidatus Saccharibacteria bacterium]